MDNGRRFPQNDWVKQPLFFIFTENREAIFKHFF